MDMILSHPAVMRVRAALVEVGLTTEVVVLDDHARTAAAAAAQLGVDTAQIANSLIFAVPVNEPPQPETPAPSRRAVLVLTSGAHRVDLAKVAAGLGVAQLERADPDFVRAQTGFAIGGVAPVAHLQPPAAIVIDRALADHDRVWAAAGHPRTVFATTFTELLRITGGVPMSVA